ncbi:GNAT family N-acetyltransferase [Cohnella sp. CFH 77786]|uniref:GNAT family N-acetyltransferase n=1 Tax=Cohnella sp. CFH 77786 TaxID=2662265 RepID=UPI001C60EE53|nr:GNAT family N-acetyltransferase [Cohnella sp. CFH 77786]MBW5446098.1 GNAT family N-acetyltransferase [Cohnella sp. CFH 77786]
MIGPSAYRILPATSAHVREIAAFLIPTMAKLYPPGAFNPEPDDLKRFEDVYVKPLDACFYIAADDRGTIVGTAAARNYDRRFPFVNAFLEPHGVCEVTKVYIDDRLRRQGIGAALYRAVESFIREAGYESSYLHTSTDLPGGFPFWLSRGYVARYQETESIVHMSKQLR